MDYVEFKYAQKLENEISELIGIKSRLEAINENSDGFSEIKITGAKKHPTGGYMGDSMITLFIYNDTISPLVMQSFVWAALQEANAKLTTKQEEMGNLIKGWNDK